MVASETCELNLAYDDNGRSRALDAYIRLFGALYLRRWPFVLVIAVLVAGVLAYLLRYHAVHAPNRYQAHTVLFYEPYGLKDYRPMDIKQLVALFERRSLMRNVKEALKADEGERDLGPGPVKLEVPRNQRNLMVVRTYGITAPHAINLANTVAQRCLVEYRDFREQELTAEKATLGRTREQKQDQLNKVNDDLLRLTHELGVVTIEEELMRLQASIALQQASLEQVHNDAIVLEARKRDAERQLSGLDGNVSKTLMKHGAQLQAFETRLQGLNQRLAKALQSFTEDNPMVSALRQEIQDCRREYDKYLLQNGIKDYNSEHMLLFDKITAEQKKIATELQGLKLRGASMQKRLEEEMARRRKLLEMMPQFRQLEQRRQQLWDDIKDVDMRVAEKNTLISVTANEVKQIEPCREATENISFGAKKIVVAIVGGIIFGMSLGAVLTFLHLLFGNVNDRFELLSFENLTLLGKYPEDPKLIRGPREEELAQNKVFHAMRHVMKEQGGILMVGAMPGANCIPELEKALDRNFFLSGKKFAHVNMVAAEEFSQAETTSDELGSQLVSIQFSGVRGVLPLDSLTSFSPVELKMLQTDCQILLTKFDVVVFHSEMKFSSHNLFWEQIMEIADALVLYVGARRTSRIALRTLSLLQKRVLKPVMTIMGVKRKWDQV